MLTYKLGATKPAKVKPLNVNVDIEIPVTKIVSK